MTSHQTRYEPDVFECTRVFYPVLYSNGPEAISCIKGNKTCKLALVAILQGDICA